MHRQEPNHPRQLKPSLTFRFTAAAPSAAGGLHVKIRGPFDRRGGGGGGETPEADLESVNLALQVHDEAQYKIPRIGEPPDPESNAVTAPAASQNPLSDKEQSPEGLIDLNKATAELLETLPGIGPVREGDIVADRELVTVGGSP